MSNFLVAVQAVVPLFFFICIGLLVRKFNIITLEEAKKVNNLVFSVFLSTTLFYNIYTADIGEVFQPKLIIFALTLIIIAGIVAAFIICAHVKDNKDRGAMLQAMIRSNFIIMGAPMVSNLFNTDKIPITAMLLAVIVPFYNIAAVVILETFRGKNVSSRTILKGIYHNPLIRGAALGVILSALHITLPGIILKSVGEISKAASPLALIVLGASFQRVSDLSSYKNLAACVTSKLILVPAFALTIAWFVGYRGMELATLIAAFGTPTAVSSFAMAQQMDSNADLTANCIVFSSGLACFTMFLWVYLFKSLGAF
jgi:predicted permease